MSRLLRALMERETWRGLAGGLVFALVWSAALQTMDAVGQQGADPTARAALEEAAQLHAETEKLIASRQFAEAAQKGERALALRRQHLGERHPEVASSLSQLGELAYSQGNYPRAETLIGQALEIREAALGPDDPAVAQSLSDLAAMLTVRGDYVRPEPLFRRALAISEKVPAGTARAAQAQELAASAQNNLGILYHRRGDYARSEEAFQKALGIRERLHGPDDATVAEAAANLGGMYYDSGQYEKAVESLKRAKAVQEKRLPANHPSLATSSSNLAAVYYDQGDYANAEALFERALQIDEQADPRHPRVAVRLTGLAETLRLKGDYERAAPLYERAAAIRQQALGAGHPSVTDTFIARSLLQYAMGNVDAAVALLSRGASLREDTLSLVLTSGSEDNKRLYLATLAEETDIAVSLHLGSARGSASAATLALTNIVQRKGRSMDAMASHMATLRRRLNDQDRATLNQFSEAQSRLATMVLRGIATDEQAKAAASLRADVERLEQTISARSTEFSVTSRTPAVTDVQRLLPPGTALIEVAAYRPFAVKTRRRDAFGAPHYAAYVLRADGQIGSADLGDAAAIDQLVRQFRAALSSPANQGVRTAARSLHRAVLQPLESSLRGIDRLLISPDGALNLIPFAALVDVEDKYLVERYTISYLTSGRDLARLRGSSPPPVGSQPAIIANPLFDGPQAAAPGAVPSAAPDARPADARMLDANQRFGALPGTAEEAAALAKVLPDARVYTGAAATEEVLKQLRAPSILHIATHGFFLQSSASDPGGTRGLTAAAPAAAAPGNRQDALVLSGLALAGANQRSSGGGEDGILTALEATGLDLWGTRMVVLSACETGVGDARNGEGVYGLRRALVLAGADSQVMSLWQVSDTATKDLMIAYYQRLRAHEGRADGLRNVQLAILRDRTRAHPFYWASFIPSGDWRELFD